jgi:hypothetical protein
MVNAIDKLSLRGTPACRRQEVTKQSHEIATLRPVHHAVQGFARNDRSIYFQSFIYDVHSNLLRNSV